MTHSRKSAAQRQKSLERLRTFREAREAAPAPRCDAPTPPAAPTVPYKSPEREAWDRAYASEQGLGPLSSKWELQGGKLTMVWLLGLNRDR